MPGWGLPALSWLISVYFLIGFVSNLGFPPSRELFLADALFVALWLFFLFLPFFSKIRVGSFLELEREIKEAKSELADFKHEMRNTVSVLSTNVNTIGGMTNHVVVNVPGASELRDAQRVIGANASPSLQETAAKEAERLSLQSEDTTLALAKTRIEIERYLRLILDRRLAVPDPGNNPIRLASARQLFEMFIRQNDQFAYLHKPFLYVYQVCNAAIHAQVVSDEQAREALTLGAQIIAVLTDFAVKIDAEDVQQR